VLVVALALFALPGGAGARSSNVHWIPIHLHLNAYAHWGKCTKFSGSGLVDSSDHAGKCYGTTGAELGELGGVSFLHHSSKCTWIWNGNQLTVGGNDNQGNSWGLEGIKSDNFWSYYASVVKIHGTEYTSGELYGIRGLKGGPLAIHLARHNYTQEISAAHGYSIDLQGYVRVK
jgi:hypothetical protein